MDKVEDVSRLKLYYIKFYFKYIIVIWVFVCEKLVVINDKYLGPYHLYEV